MVWRLVSSSGHFIGTWLITFRVKGPFDPEGEDATMLLNVWTIHPLTERHITVDLRFNNSTQRISNPEFSYCIPLDMYQLLFSQLTLIYQQILPNSLTFLSISGPPLPLKLWQKHQTWETSYKGQLRKRAFSFCTVYFCICIQFLYFTYIINRLLPSKLILV